MHQAIRTLPSRTHTYMVRMLIGFVIALLLMISWTSITHAQETDKHGDEEAQYDRLSGPNRFQTAVEVSQTGWRHGADAVVIARYDDFADSLVGTPLAYILDAPILLTHPAELQEDTAAEIKRLQPDTVYILGGSVAVSENVKAEVADVMNQYDATKSINDIERIGGGSRYETATTIAERVWELQSAAGQKVIVSNARSFPDALSIAPYAAQEGIPIVLTEHNELPNATAQLLQHVHEAIVVGGYNAVSDNLAIPNETRIRGANRFETTAAIIREFNMMQHTNSVYVASGDDFPDALTGSVLAAKNNAPILLTNDRIPEPIAQIIRDHDIQSFIGIGGTTAVGNVVLQGLVNIANGIEEPEETVRIMIDPGHGGRDSGAVGNGIREKDVALDMSLIIRDVLENNYSSVEVNMTRTTDVFIELADRAQMANDWNADYFVSIHSNAFSEQSSGFETFIFNGNVSATTIEKRDKIHDYIVQNMQEHMPADMDFRDRGKKRANFAVLRGTRMPAILIENLFISNPDEAALLGDPEFLETLATINAEAIAYAWDLPLK